jgi:hypothetical protein
MRRPGEAHPAWCVRPHRRPGFHATDATTVWNGPDSRLLTSIEMRGDETAPSIVVMSLTPDGVTVLRLPVQQAGAVQVGIFMLLTELEASR